MFTTIGSPRLPCEGLFHDNELHRTVYLEAELRSTTQGDSSIDEYCTTLKRITDKLRDIS